jgi:hypothetical protein
MAIPFEAQIIVLLAIAILSRGVWRLIRFVCTANMEATVFLFIIKLTVMIHTSTPSRWKLDVFLRKYREEVHKVKYLLVHSNATKLTCQQRALGVSVPVECEDKWDSLVCKGIGAYKYFLAHPELGDWLYRAMDDSFVNITNLLTHISHLEQIYDQQASTLFCVVNETYNIFQMEWYGLMVVLVG